MNFGDPDVSSARWCRYHRKELWLGCWKEDDPINITDDNKELLIDAETVLHILRHAAAATPDIMPVLNR